MRRQLSLKSREDLEGDDGRVVLLIPHCSSSDETDSLLLPPPPTCTHSERITKDICISEVTLRGSLPSLHTQPALTPCLPHIPGDDWFPSDARVDKALQNISTAVINQGGVHVVV